MKKILAILLTFSLLMTAVAALAEDNASAQNQMPTTNGPGPFPGGGRPEDMPEPPNGEKPDAAPEKPAGEQPEDAPEAPNGEKPDAAPEKPTGEKPEDAPAEVHRILLGAEIVLLEGIVLTDVRPGRYLLSAAPLALGGCDGAPCRAYLMR